MFDISLTAGTKQLRQFAWACLPGFALFAWAVHRWGATNIAASIVAALGLVLWLIGLARPTALRLPYMLLMLVAAPIGWIVMRLGLLIVFFVLLVPLALLFKALGRDALHLRSKNGWHQPDPRGEAKSYFRMS